MSWIDDVNSKGVAAIARACGLDDMHNRSFGPCLACREVNRSSSDKRGPIGVRHDDAGWVCHRCKISGPPIKLVILKLIGPSVTLSHDDWSNVRGWCVDKGFCDPSIQGYTFQRSYRIKQSDEDPVIKLLNSKAKTYDVKMSPGAEDVFKFWSSCNRVSIDMDCVSWLTSRSIDFSLVDSAGVARSLPRGVSAPWSNIRGKSWYDAGYRLIIPMYDSSGAISAIRARRVINIDDGMPKSSAMSGLTVRGVVMASFNAIDMLSSGNESQSRRVIIAEGEPDFLTLSSNPEWVGEIDSPAVIGIVSGSWDDTIAARVADGSTVVIATHNDTAGEKYSSEISKSLAVRASYGMIKLRRLVFG